jgi:hypothetical protein
MFLILRLTELLLLLQKTAKMAVYAQTEKGKKQLKQTQKKEEEHLAAFIKLCPGTFYGRR